jgi:HK97 family phage major capsid protein
MSSAVNNYQPKPPIELTRREKSNYSILRAIRSLDRKENSFEVEVSEEIRRTLGSHGSSPLLGGLLVPTLFNRAGLDTKTASKGSELVFTEAGQFISELRANSQVLKAGATLISGLHGNVDLPKLLAGGSATFMQENPPVGVAETSMTTGSVPLRLKTTEALVSFSRQLLAQAADPGIESIVYGAFGRAHGAAVDRSALWGSSAASEPQGIFNALIPVNWAGPIDFPKTVALERAIADADGETGPLSFIATPGVRAAARQTAKAATIQEPIWDDENRMLGYPAFASNSCLQTLPPPGTSQAMVLGAWAECYMGDWGALQIISDPFTRKREGMIEVMSYFFLDINFAHLESFAAAVGITG